MQMWGAASLPVDRPLSWIGSISLAIAVSVAYFFAAQLSLELLTKPDGVAVFWPAAGMSSGTLIAFGQRVRLPVTVGVVVASTLASLLGDRSIAAAAVFALCNAGEPLLVAWLITRWFSDDFRLESLPSVLGFFAAAGIGPAISGSLATVGFVLFYSSTAPVLTTWLNWFAADALGIIMVAPLLIGLSGLQREFPDRSELAAGTLTLALLLFVTATAFSSPAHYWYTALPLAMLLPVLLAAYCSPVFAAAAALTLGFAVVWTTTFGISDFGEPQSLHDRAYAGRATLLAISTCTLVLAALFAERRHKEVALKDSNDRLADGLAAGEVIAFEWNAITRQSSRSNNASLILGKELDGRSQPNEFLKRVHPDDRQRLRRYIHGVCPENPSYGLSFRFCCVDGRLIWLEERARGEFDTAGRLLRIKGLTRDITDRKQSEHMAQRLVSVVESSEDAIVSKDLNGVIVSWNQGAERLFGYSAEEVIGKPILILIPLDRQHEEIMILERIRLGEPVKHYETVRRRKNGTLVDISLTISPVRDAAGVVVGASKIARDITERKKAEATLAERTMQLAIAGKAALVGSFAYDVDTERLQITPGYAAIHGLPDGTTEIARSEWKVGVHPEDRARWETLRSHAHREQCQEYSGEYRIVRAGGEVRWIEARVFVSYASDGRPQRAVGIDIDITERKRADEQQRALNAELDHRVKNVLATVSAIITQTPKAGISLADFVAGFDGRVKSLARTHELLSHNHWQDVLLAEVVRREIAPYAAGNATILGPGVTLKAAAAQAVATVFHELATNAAKYGAFSMPGGRLFVGWCWLNNGSHSRLAIQWRESGGPAVSTPSQTGFGTSVIRELIPFELGGTVDLTFASNGLQCRLGIPADWLSSDTPIGERGFDLEQIVGRN
jgi:PAS domain S-box-containing protein